MLFFLINVNYYFVLFVYYYFYVQYEKCKRLKNKSNKFCMYCSLCEKGYHESRRYPEIITADPAILFGSDFHISFTQINQIGANCLT